jgi:pimeloyl-ACP methyl ester carboxylesterase
MAVKEIKYQNNFYLINYDIINNNQDKIILFLHGWGSNKEIMKKAFSDNLKEFKHIYIDMPGFGKSFNKYVLNTSDYFKIVQEFLLKFQLKNRDLTIIGHSFGGKVATFLNPKTLILLSSAGILEIKSTKTLLTIRMAKIFNRFGLSKVTKMLRSKDVNNMSQNMYETFKNVVDEDFSLEFQKYNGETLIFWGNQDQSTTLESGKTINRLIKNSYFKSYDGDHYFFLKYNKDICDIITKKLLNS